MGTACSHVKAEAEETAEEAVKQISEVADLTVQKVEHVVEAIADAVPEEVKAVADAVIVQPVKEVIEAVAGTMEAAAAAATNSMIIDFEISKGKTKAIDFKHKNLGFDHHAAGFGCCAPSGGKPKLQVTKVTKGGQADQLGVKRKWVIVKVNGADATCIEEGRKLLNEALEKLPEDPAAANRDQAAPAAQEEAAGVPPAKEEAAAGAETKVNGETAPPAEEGK